MIELHIEEHCQNCPNFEVEQSTIHIADMQGKTQTEHNLKCKNEDVCKRIAEHLQGCYTGKGYAEGLADGFIATLKAEGVKK